MSKNTILCKCLICLKQNKNGILISMRTYNRHRKNQQEFLDIGEININHQEQNIEEEDLYKQEDLYQQENLQEIIYQQDENYNNFDTDDTESFNFNEEDIEYYSDYNNNNNSDNDSDDDDDNDENNNDIMQIDNEINISNKEIIEGLKLLYLKTLYNFTESAYDDIMKIFTTNNLSLYKIKKYLKDITNLIPVFYDMCENSCICYTGQYEFYQNCLICNSTRFDTKGKAKKIMPYLSIKNRLQIQFNDENRAKELLYRHEYILNKEQNDNNLQSTLDTTNFDITNFTIQRIFGVVQIILY